jgi:hypothetical protein
MQAFITDAGRDLREAELWLEHATTEQSVYLLQLVDAATDFAQARLTAAEEAIATRGPDATLIG